MKKVILLLLIAAVVFSCKKNETITTDNKVAEISFNITSLYPENERVDAVPVCPDPELMPNYALIYLDGYAEPFRAEVFYIEGVGFYTQALRMDAPRDYQDDCWEYTLTGFELYHETLGDDVADILVKATPAEDSPFEDFLTNDDFTLPMIIEVCEFEKFEYDIEVLCYVPHQYDLFGFFWFNITEITVRTMCFFGDICLPYFGYSEAWWLDTNDPPNYYKGQSLGIQMDMPAIFKIEVYNDGVWMRTYDNMNTLGEEPLCVSYADYDDQEDPFEFRLFVYGPPNWDYVEVGSWFFTDDIGEDGIDTNDDGVADFVLGMCNEDPEYVFPGDYILPLD